MKIGGSPPSAFTDPRRDEFGRGSGESGAFGFDELGLFGLDRRPQAVPTEPLQAKRGAEMSSPREARDTTRSPEVARVAPDAAAPTPASRLVPRRTGAQTGALEPQPSAPGVPSARPGATAGPTAQFSGGSVEPMSGEEAAPAATLQPQHASPAHVLIVATRDGAASIAVKAPPLDGEGRALLRRLVRQILAERRFSLADFQLNGAPLEADFLSMTGVSHGSRAR